MKQKTYNIISGVIFLVVATLHLVRIIYGWQILVGDSFAIPFWISWVGFIAAGILAYFGFKFSK